MGISVTSRHSVFSKNWLLVSSRNHLSLIWLFGIGGPIGWISLTPYLQNLQWGKGCRTKGRIWVSFMFAFPAVSTGLGHSRCSVKFVGQIMKAAANRISDSSNLPWEKKSTLIEEQAFLLSKAVYPKRDELGAISVTRKPPNQPNKNPNTFSNFPFTSGGHCKVYFHVWRGIFWTWVGDPGVHLYFLQKAMLFRDASVHHLLTAGPADQLLVAPHLFRAHLYQGPFPSFLP